MNCNDRGFSPIPQEGRNVDLPKERPTCVKCGKKNGGECLVGTNSWYGCGKDGNMVKYCPNARSQGKGISQDQPCGPNSKSQKRNRFYALKVGGEKGSSMTLSWVGYKFYLLMFTLCLT